MYENTRIADLAAGLTFGGNATYKLYNSQFVDCDSALAQTHAAAVVQMYNVLFSDDNKVFTWAAGAGSPHVTFQHITADHCEQFAAGLGAPPSGTWSGKNSLLVEIAQSGTIPSTGLESCHRLDSASGVFTTGGEGSGGHYLAGATYRAVGSQNIDAVLLAELPQKTTHPPIDLPLSFTTSGSITFFPQVPRYDPNAADPDPDIGHIWVTSCHSPFGL